MIRATVEEDLGAIKRVIQACGLFPPEMLEPMLRPFLDATGDGSIWLTLQDPNPVGVVYCVPEKLTEGTWNMLLLAVHPEFQHSGRGMSLVSHLEVKLKKEGCRLVIVETSGLDQYEQARRFYRKIGYSEEARIREFYAPGEDKVIFVKAL